LTRFLDYFLIYTKSVRTRKKQFALLLMLLLLALLATPSQAFAKGPVQSGPSVVDVALEINTQTGEFSTLIAAAVCTNLVVPLDRKPGVTVFAPTDAAFAELGLDASNVCNIPRHTLSNILRYHIVINRALLSGDVVASDTIRMANGQLTDISVTDDGVFINDAQIIVVDVVAANGIIHVIDGVLLP
ncbi:MAG TPA: fasciclin domain-containing protein, partial [Chloroflexota bacterium]|nr:fasciclin domain-containing protein [Chloroflexota bacterium]